MKLVERHLQKCELKWIVVKTRELIMWNCVRLLVLYCCDSPEGKDMSAVRYSVTLKSLCARCMFTSEDIIIDKMPDYRSVRHTNMVKSRLL